MHATNHIRATLISIPFSTSTQCSVLLFVWHSVACIWFATMRKRSQWFQDCQQLLFNCKLFLQEKVSTLNLLITCACAERSLSAVWAEAENDPLPLYVPWTWVCAVPPFFVPWALAITSPFLIEDSACEYPSSSTSPVNEPASTAVPS